MRIYTRGGDTGETGLFGGRRVPKDAPRVEAYGDVDELTAVLGLARAQGLEAELATRVARVQAELMTVASELATPDPSDQSRTPHVDPGWTVALERDIDAADAELPTLRQFILPGGTAAGAWLHVARTVCRRAERATVALSRMEPVDPAILVYLNRLSDWLFVTARLANLHAGTPDVVWRAPK